MKSFLLFIALLFAVILSSSAAPSVNYATTAAKKQRATMTFNDPVQLMGLKLRGEYLFVHDQEAMMRGEACTYVYKGAGENRSNLVISFHCTPAVRDKANGFRVLSVLIAPGLYEVREFQFGGDTEAHLVPTNPQGEHLNIAPPPN